MVMSKGLASTRNEERAPTLVIKTRWPLVSKIAEPVISLIACTAHSILIFAIATILTAQSWVDYQIRLLRRRFKTLTCGLSRFDNEPFLLSQFQKQYGDKLPRHVAIVLQNPLRDGVRTTSPKAIEQENLKGNVETDFLAKLVHWCEVLTIPCVTLYDDTDKILALQDEMYDLLENYRHPNGKPLTMNGNHQNGKCANGHSPVAGTKLRFSGRSTGKQQVFEALSSIINKRSETSMLPHAGGDTGEQFSAYSQLAADQIEPRDISSLIKSKDSFPPPDMLVMVGSTPSSFGYSPWQLRLTEFFLFPPTKPDDVSVEDFLDLFRSYGRIEKRFGK